MTQSLIDAKEKVLNLSPAPIQEFAQLAADEQIARTVAALNTHGIRALVVETGAEARNGVLGMIPVLIVNAEMPGRIKIVLVKQNLGF